ncbi:MAG: acyl-CoA dehydrogenase family protein, partial [Rhodanobacter sp.]
MSVILTLLAALLATGACAYHRSSLRTWAIATVATTLVVGLILHAPWTMIILLIIELAIAVPLLMVGFRRHQISAPLLKLFAKVTPKLSETEQTALEAGTVGFEGELFSGKPHWSKLLREPKPELFSGKPNWHELLKPPKPELSVEEQAFLDGPVEQLCAMIDDWQITHELADLPPNVWEFIKHNKFFGMIIPKQYGGLQFSALAHSAVLQKLNSMSATVASTVAVPNSLGPAELLL